ncbi:MAG: nascent polypeptide-associated complex protein [Promethearchaeota archaeon]
MRRRMRPRDMERAMRKMGMKVETLDAAEEVIIRLPDKEILISSPQVFITDTKGHKVFQISGNVTERAHTAEAEDDSLEEIKHFEPPEEDIKLVAQQTGVSAEEAKSALMASGGDLAQAILSLKSTRG